MNRALQLANSFGIGTVAILCVLQWRSIARIDADRDRLESTRQTQSNQIEQQRKTIADQSADLDDYRKRLVMAEDQLKSLQLQLTAAVAERNQLRDALLKWKAAVESRDATLNEASAQIDSLAKQRDGAIAKFNDIAIKYNELVKRTAQ